ncbi:ankyrin repeat-containing protein [Fusarium sp. NRRL 52700]|nr:ankyrin repeat-containing protein [Fusarium sp. NRRL 52700]
MADPLSVAGLALAVVSLGLQVTGGITEYFDSLKSRDQDIASIIQQNNMLRKTLQIIESSISRFQNDHRPATEALRQFLDSCNKELKDLESMVAALNTGDQCTTSRRTKARNNGKKLLYPFHRPKVEQMATKLHHINATLQLGLQSLGLSVSHLGSEKLAILQATSQTISSDLLVVQSEVLSISTPIRGIQTTMSQFETRFDGLENLIGQLLVQGSTINGALQNITPELFAGRLVSKPAVLQEMCDAVVTQERHRPKGKSLVPHQRAAKVRTEVSSYTGGRFSCLCRRRRHVQRWNALGSLVLSHETITERHLPGCPAAQTILEPDRSQSFALTFAGLRSLLNSAIQFSFTIRSGAGGCSFGPNFTYYPVVDSNRAPAFKMLDLLMNSYSIGFNRSRLGVDAWKEKIVPSVVSSVLSLFQGRKASPRAVNEHNESLVYKVALCADNSQASPLIDLLEHLVNNKAPANDYNTSGDTPLSTIFSPWTNSCVDVTHPVLAASVDLILRSNTDNAVMNRQLPYFLSYSIETPGGEIERPGFEVLPRFLSYSTQLADGLCLDPLNSAWYIMLTKTAYGCGPLGAAVLSDNLEEVKLLIENHPSTLSERNLFGHTPLHLAADKPSILRVLVDAADTKLLNWTDHKEYSALDLAVSLSGIKCAEHTFRMCKRCRCAESAVILLKADCALRSLTLRRALSYASKRCKLRLLRYMKDRRDRLKRLGLDNLSGTDIEQLGLESEHVLDSNAFKVSQLLQKRSICVPEALAVADMEIFAHFRPMYQVLDSPDDADLCFRVGFRDVASWCNDNDLARWGFCRRKSLPYLRWLADNGGIRCQLPFPTVKDIFGSVCIFSAIGREISYRLDQSNESDSGSSLAELSAVDPEEAWYHEVHSAVFEARTVDSCSCQCSPSGCNMLTFILRELVDEEIYSYDAENRALYATEPSENALMGENALLKLIYPFIMYLSQFSCHCQRWHHYATIRFITCAALEIGHSCCRTDDVHRVFEDDLDSVDGLGDDQGCRLVLLEDLINEFEEIMTSLLEDPDAGTDELINFWKSTWVHRMTEVLVRLESSDLPEDERRAAEEIGVVWDNVGPEPPVDMGNPHKRDELEYWLYELRKIEEECQ